MNCDEMTAHLIDLLQGELPADQLRSATEHLLHCPCCTALKMSFLGVRELVHQSLERPLDPADRAELARAVLVALADEGATTIAPPDPQTPSR